MYKRIRDPPMDVKCVVVGEAAEVTRLKTGCLWWAQEWWTQLPTWYTPPPHSTLHHLLSCLIYFNLCRRSLTVDTRRFLNAHSVWSHTNIIIIEVLQVHGEGMIKFELFEILKHKRGLLLLRSIKILFCDIRGILVFKWYCLYADWISLNWPSNVTRSKYTNRTYLYTNQDLLS